MEEKSSARFSEYLFAKMGGHDVSASQGPRKMTADTRKWMRENLLLLVTLSGVLLGILLGFGLRPLKLGDDAVMLISYPGELFMRLLKLMILPLVIASLISGSASLNAKMNGKIAVRTLVYFLLTSLFNAILGVALALLIHPGNSGIRESMGSSTQTRAVNILDSLLDLGRNMFPDNLFQAAFQQAHTVYVPKKPQSQNETAIDGLINNGAKIPGGGGGEEELMRSIQYRSGTNTLGIVFFCLVFGTFLGTLGEKKGQIVIEFFKAVFEVIMRMVSMVMWMTPVGITSVIAGKILGVSDLALVMSQLAWFIVTIVFGVFFYQLVVMQLIYLAIVRKNPFKFYAGLAQGTLTAFAMASTAAALPVTFRLMTEKLNVDPRVTRFVLPIGCNINMDGTALFVATASIFIAQMNDIFLGFGEIITVILTSTAASVSSASVPSAALVLLLVVLSAIDAPVQDVSLLFAIDWFVDRVRTTNNMLGDCYAAAVVEHLSKKELMALDAAAYQSETVVLPTTIMNGCISANRVPDPKKLLFTCLIGFLTEIMVFYFKSDVVQPPVTLFMGIDKHENEDLIKWGWPEDVWFHVDKFSSAHVYLRLRPGQTIDDIPSSVLEDAAQLVKANSIEGNKVNDVDIVYTMWANLKKTQGMEVGQVGFHKEKEVRKIHVTKRLNTVVNRLNKTKTSAEPNFRLEREERDRKEREDKKKLLREQKEAEKAELKRREEEAQLKNYSSLFQSTNMTTNTETGYDSDDFM